MTEDQTNCSRCYTVRYIDSECDCCIDSLMIERDELKVLLQERDELLGEAVELIMMTHVNGCEVYSRYADNDICMQFKAKVAALRKAHSSDVLVSMAKELDDSKTALKVARLHALEEAALLFDRFRKEFHYRDNSAWAAKALREYAEQIALDAYRAMPEGEVT